MKRRYITPDLSIERFCNRYTIADILFPDDVGETETDSDDFPDIDMSGNY